MTTGQLFSVEEAIAYLRAADPVLAGVMDRAWPYLAPHRADPYAALLRSILFQQLAGAAAAAIQRRLFTHFGDEENPPAPIQLLSATDEEFRAVGLSRQKTSYLRDLALHVVEGRLDLAALPTLSDEDVIKHLVAVKGIGEWTAHMFLMFHLGRPDVLPIGDLGVRNGMRIAYGLDEMPAPARATEIGAKWAPYRSVGSWYMWRVAEPVAPEI